jgi:hypothetical protein
MGKYTSEDEEIIEKLDNVHLTRDRIIKKTSSWGNVDYQDIQLDKITGFSHDRKINLKYLGISGILGIVAMRASQSAILQRYTELIAVAAGVFLLVFLVSIKKDYYIQTVNPDLDMKIKSSEEVFDFWKKVNDQKNS